MGLPENGIENTGGKAHDHALVRYTFDKTDFFTYLFKILSLKSNESVKIFNKID